MRVLCVLLPLLALAVVEGEEELVIRKCCGVFQMVSGDGRSCVDAPWPRLPLEQRGNTVLRPHDARWLSRWLPPGVPLHRVGEVEVDALDSMPKYHSVRPVKESTEWNRSRQIEEGVYYWSDGRVIFRGKFSVMHTFKQSKMYSAVAIRLIDVYFLPYFLLSLTTDVYCVDAAGAQLAPFALLREPKCLFDNCLTECCGGREVVANEGGRWACSEDARGSWSPADSTFARFIHPQVIFDDSPFESCLKRSPVQPRALRLAPGDFRAIPLLRGHVHENFFSSWDTCVDFERLDNITLTETIFYCEYSRITRGIYWLLRPLSFVSASLLVLALVSIGCSSGMRAKVHGWCLGCHAACLLLFNVGQLIYYFSLSDEIEDMSYQQPFLWIMCKNIVLPMYFLLMGANCWLTALCINMAFGFGRLQMVRPGGGRGCRRFLALSAFAWGLPTLMTSWSAYAFGKGDASGEWYKPTFTETRTCFSDYFVISNTNKMPYLASNNGAILFYYGPVGTLVITNALCVGYTFSKVLYLRHGNAVLRGEEDGPSRGRRPREKEENHAAVNPALTAVADAKTVRLYLKMMLMTGMVEIIAEAISWALIPYANIQNSSSIDHLLAYRATGYVLDCFRAACVAWLAAPEGGYRDALRRWVRGVEQGPGTRRGGVGGGTGRRRAR